MLNLIELERKLDLALANETTESLTNWLEEKRLRTFLQSLGNGTFDTIVQFKLNELSIKKESSYFFEVTDFTLSPNQELQSAA